MDDVALRKRPTSGTILVDLEHRQPVALLPDRTAEMVAPGLREPPRGGGARSGARAYAEGARLGASAATQGADRFPLLQNRAEALQQVCATQSPALDAVKTTLSQQPVPRLDGVAAVPVPPRATPAPAPQRAARAPARRQRV